MGSSSKARTFSDYLKRHDPALFAHVDEAKPAARATIIQAFRTYDDCLRSLGSSVDAELWHEAMAGSLRIAYDQYVRGIKNTRVNQLGRDLTNRVERELLKEQPDINERHLMLSVERAAEDGLDKTFDSLFGHPQANKLLKQFVDEFTQGFFVLNQQDPGYVEEFLTMDIAIFRLGLYLMLTDELPRLRR